jgi:hypothetical protein
VPSSGTIGIPLCCFARSGTAALPKGIIPKGKPGRHRIAAAKSPDATDGFFRRRDQRDLQLPSPNERRRRIVAWKHVAARRRDRIDMPLTGHDDRYPSKCYALAIRKDGKRHGTTVPLTMGREVHEPLFPGTKNGGVETRRRVGNARLHRQASAPRTAVSKGMTRAFFTTGSRDARPSSHVSKGTCKMHPNSAPKRTMIAWKRVDRHRIGHAP